MKIVLAFDSFKGSMSNLEINKILKKALSNKLSSTEIIEKPLADGGEGTLEVLKQLPNVKTISKTVKGPKKGMSLEAEYLFFPTRQTVFIELAQAAGLPHLKKSELDPFSTTTFGVGELIKDSLQYNPKEIILAIGGSATNDLGTGAAMALGWKFLKHDKTEIELGAKELSEIKSIIKPELSLPKIKVLCDVNNPLCGPEGASFVYGPQKGASKNDCQILDQSIQSLSTIIEQEINIDLSNIPGAGAAGGMGGGAVAFLNAELLSGVETIMELTGLDQEILDADWILSGEGRLDQQSLSGKVVSGLLKKKPANCKLGLIVGQSLIPKEEVLVNGVDFIYSLSETAGNVKKAIEQTRDLLKLAANQFCQNVK